MEIKIGMKNVARELSLDIEQTLDELKKQLQQAIEDQKILDLVDKRGAHTLINGNDVAYVEFSPERQNRIGFAL